MEGCTRGFTSICYCADCKSKWPSGSTMRLTAQPFHTTAWDKTYKGISRLAKEYFVLLCGMRNLRGTYDVVDEDPSGTHQSSETFTIALSGRETYDVMQKVYLAAYGKNGPFDTAELAKADAQDII